MNWLQGRDVHRIILEPSEGYERSVLYHLVEQGLPVSLVHARSVRHFALAQGVLAKRERLDTKTLVQYGSLFSPELTIVPSEVKQQLSHYVRRRSQLLSLLSTEKIDVRKLNIL